MTGLAIVYSGSWGATGQKISPVPVQSIPKASLHWAADQLTTGKAMDVWYDRVTGKPLSAPSVSSQWPVVYESFRKVVRFDGVDDRLDVPVDLSGAKTMIVVGRFSRSTGGTYAITGGTGKAFNLYIGGNGNFAFFASSTLTSNKPGDTNNHVFIVVSNGATSTLRIDDTEWAGDAGASTATGMRVGATSTAYTPMDIQSLAVLPYAADVAERTQLVASLRSQYGI